MFDLFYIPKVGEKSLHAASVWRNTKDLHILNTNKIVSYYQQYPMSINSSHVLVRLIYAMNISKSLPIERFFDYCKVRTYSTAQTLGFTSPISRGKIWDGDFYGNGSKEIIIANDDWFDLSTSQNDWKKYRSVTVLHHSKSDLNHNIPDGRFTSSEQGLAVITINIPMLMVQYYYFTKEQDIAERSGGARKSIMQFIYMYALTNMMYSHVNYALFNRMYKKSLSLPVGFSFYKHSFGLANSVDLTDKTLISVDAFLKANSNLKMYQKFINIPSVFSDSFADDLTLPTVAPTMQIYWALILTRLRALSYILNTYKNPRKVLGSELNLIQRWLRTHQVVKSIENILDSKTYSDLENDIVFLQTI